VLDNDHRLVTEIQREVEQQTMYTMESVTGVSVPTSGAITVQLETPKASITVELDTDHPAIEDIDLTDYWDSQDEDDIEPSITERLEEQ